MDTSWVSWLDEYQSTITIFFSFVVMVATGVIAWASRRYANLTAALVAETEKLRKAQTEPRVSVHLQWDFVDHQVVNLIVRNDGFTQARDLQFEVKPDFNYTPRKKLSDHWLMQGIPSLLPSEGHFLRMSTLTWFKMKKEKKDDVVPDQVKITVSYSDTSGDRKQESFLLNFRSFKEDRLSGMPPSALEKISGSLTRIAAGIGSSGSTDSIGLDRRDE